MNLEVKNAVDNHAIAGNGVAIIIGMSPWKEFIKYWISAKSTKVLYKNASVFRILIKTIPSLILNENIKIYTWAYKHPKNMKIICDLFNIPLVRIEDGFLRSVKLGAMKTPPISLCFDNTGMYFDPSTPSDLESVIQHHDFKRDTLLLERARAGIDRLARLGLSKYNMGVKVDATEIYGPKVGKRILVIGQVDHDMSIIKGCEQKINSNDLVHLARLENPTAQIIYKPHPEILHGTRGNDDDPRSVSDIALVLEEDISLSDAFETIDHVYTITSLAGFEALLRDIPVTCIGAPFYSGWGVTDDRQPVERRTAKRTVIEIFAAAYILYPRYFDPEKRTEITFEEALHLLQKMRDEAMPKDKEACQETDNASPAAL